MEHTVDRKFISSLVVGLALVCGNQAIAAPVQPQHWYRELPTKPEKTTLREHHRTDAIWVKYMDATDIDVSEGRLVSRDADEQARLSSELEFEIERGMRVSRMVEVNNDKLLGYRENARQYHGRDVADLSKWFTIQVPKGVDAATLIDKFNASPFVEIATPAPKPPPPPQSCTSPPGCESLQGYLFSPANPNSGINASAVWSQYANGAGVKIADLEYNYHAPHDDFPTITDLLGNSPSGPGAGHGTSMLGIIGSKKNLIGTSGITHGSTVYFSRVDYASLNVPAAITAAMNALSPGDVILLEMQAWGDDTPYVYAPAEWQQPWYDAIVNAVGNGYIVVMGAGNGSANLNHSSFNAKHKPFLPQNDSGSIIVGAGSPSAQVRYSYSGYGSRVNIQGWGGGVYSTAAPNSYTGGASGTSSASAIAAGAAALLQSAYKSQTSQMATPAVIRSALMANGTPQGAPTSTWIGPLPNVLAAVQSMLAGPPGIPPNFSVSSWLCYGQGQASWGSATGASSYQLQASYSPSFTSPWYEYVGSGQSVFLNVSYTTYFRVRACNGAGCSSYSSTQSLTPLSGCY